MSSRLLLTGKTILVTQWQLINYAGSELVTLELAEALIAHGARVVVATCAYDYPIRSQFEKLKEVLVYEIGSKELGVFIKNEIIDIVWVHHSVVPRELLEKKQLSIKFIFHHMSPFSPIEFPLLCDFEFAAASKVLFNSEETKKAITDSVPGIKKTNLEVFNNPAPEKFSSGKNRVYFPHPKKLLIVSNHIPKELREAIELLSKKGISAKYFGSETDEFSRIEPADIQSADVVVTIGKTVQYSLLGKTPVFCYDHFGGPGYLQQDNYQVAEDLNFSGRGFQKKTAKEIANEIIKDYSSAVAFSSSLDSGMFEKFNLNIRVEAVIKEVLGMPPKAAIPLPLIQAFVRLTSVLDMFIKDSANLKHFYERIVKAENDNKTLQSLNDKLELRIEMINKSRIWKLRNKTVKNLRIRK